MLEWQFRCQHSNIAGHFRRHIQLMYSSIFVGQNESNLGDCNRNFLSFINLKSEVLWGVMWSAILLLWVTWSKSTLETWRMAKAHRDVIFWYHYAGKKPYCNRSFMCLQCSFPYHYFSTHQIHTFSFSSLYIYQRRTGAHLSWRVEQLYNCTHSIWKNCKCCSDQC